MITWKEVACDCVSMDLGFYFVAGIQLIPHFHVGVCTLSFTKEINTGISNYMIMYELWDVSYNVNVFV